MRTITIIINLTQCIGYACRADKNPYRHDRRADKNPYRHDRHADKNPYRHDRRADSQCRFVAVYLLWCCFLNGDTPDQGL